MGECMKKGLFFVIFFVFGFCIVFTQNISKYQQEIEKIISDFQVGKITMAEIENRSSILTADIASGNIREDARNDIEWRRQWITRLTETENYFNDFFKTNSLPYTLFYSASVKQGSINYQTETMTINMDINLHGLANWLLPVEGALYVVYKTLYEGLDATGRKTEWGLDRWPQQSLTNFVLFGRRNKSFTITAELVNSKNKVIGKSEFQTVGYWQVQWNNGINTQVSDDDKKTINFTNVKPDDITDNLTIRITRVNGEDAQAAARKGVLQVKALSESEWETNAIYQMNKGTIIGISGKGGELIIPNTIWDDLVVAIGEGGRTNGSSASYSPLRNINVTSVTIPDSVNIIRLGAFSGSQLSKVTIGNGVTIIEGYAFSRNNLKSIIISDSVITIGGDAFRDNNLTDVIIGNSVKNIGAFAFYGNPLTNITIGENVEIFGNAMFWEGFKDTYNNLGRRAGTYTRPNAKSSTWTRQ